MYVLIYEHVIHFSTNLRESRQNQRTNRAALNSRQSFDLCFFAFIFIFTLQRLSPIDFVQAASIIWIGTSGDGLWETAGN